VDTALIALELPCKNMRIPLSIKNIPLLIKNIWIIEPVELNIFVMLLSFHHSVVMDGHHLVLRLRMSGAVPPLPYMTS